MSNPTELPDLDRLEALAKQAGLNGWPFHGVAFQKAANPAAVLALIALARRPPVPAQRPTDDELWDSTIRDRDTYHEWADKLADAIAVHFGVDIGEHSNQNCPWHEALEAIESAEPDRRAQPEGEAPAPRTELSKRIREAATADVTLAQARLLIGAAEEIERAQQAAAPGSLVVGDKLLVDIATGVLDQFGMLDGLSETRTEELCHALQAAFDRVACSDPGTPEAPDTLRLNMLGNEVVDTIYMDDGRIIDVGGKHAGNLRAALDKFAAQLDGGQGESHA